MRKFTPIIIMLFYVSAITAQTTIRNILGNMPENMTPYLNAGQRAEIIRFTESKDSIKVKNSLNGMTSVETVNDNFIKISLNEAASMQMKLLPLNDSTQIICTVKTIKTPIPESTIKFYTTEWLPIDSTFNLPETDKPDTMIELLVQRPDTMSESRFNELRNYIEPVIISAEISNDDNIITYNLSLPLMPGDKSDELKAIIKKKSFKWNGDKFKKC